MNRVEVRKFLKISGIGFTLGSVLLQLFAAGITVATFLRWFRLETGWWGHIVILVVLSGAVLAFEGARKHYHYVTLIERRVRYGPFLWTVLYCLTAWVLCMAWSEGIWMSIGWPSARSTSLGITGIFLVFMLVYILPGGCYVRSLCKIQASGRNLLENSFSEIEGLQEEQLRGVSTKNDLSIDEMKKRIAAIESKFRTMRDKMQADSLWLRKWLSVLSKDICPDRHARTAG